MKNILLGQCERINRKIDGLNKYSTQFTKGRVAVFILGVIYAYFFYGILSDGYYLLGLMICTVAFLILVARHYKVHQSIEKFDHLKSIKEDHIARMELDWDNIPESEIPFTNSEHPFANDLDIIGRHSIRQLVDTSIYEGSHIKLTEWLTTEHPDKVEVSRRQMLVKQLLPLQLFRDKLRMIGLYTTSHTSEKDWSMEEMLKWLRNPVKTGFKKPLILLGSLAVLNISFGIMALAGVLGITPFLVSLLVYLTAYKLNSDKVSGLFDAAFQLEKLMNRFRALLLHIEGFDISDKKELNELLKVYHEEDARPSVFLKKVKRIAGAASLQANQVLWPLVNLVIPWDMYYSMRLESLKLELEPKLTVWLDIFYDLEALNSLANFAVLNPDYSFPCIEEDPEFLFNADELGHPLISSSEKVTNDFSVHKKQDLFLITGSNMAGKSTFLRTVGVNLALTFAGAPVNARSLKTRLFRLFTSINVVDSLDEGFSHFYAEVRRLRQLLNALNKKDEIPLFFFVDEIFRGTNNKERLIGSQAFLKAVAGKNGAGMVSTHDLELATLEEEVPQLSNFHFEETIEDCKMSFEYKLKSGPCRSTNALRIMEMEGLPV